MIAVLLVNGWRLAEAEIADGELSKACGGKPLGPGNDISIVLFDEHPRPDARRLMLNGKLETM